MFPLGGDGRLYSGDGYGDKSFRYTLNSLPPGYHICVYTGFTLVNLTSSTSRSFLLFRTNSRSITLPGGDNQVGKEDSQGDQRWNTKNLSWGVVFVAVEKQISDRM